VPYDALLYAQTRGTAVHRACELHLLDDLDESSIDSEVRHYFEQFLAFLDDSGFKPKSTEERVYSARYDYAGTLDLFGGIGRKQNCLIDIKTPLNVSPVTGVQTAAYENAFREMHYPKQPPITIHRYSLQLRPNKYEIVPFTDKKDWHVFLSLKLLFNWRQKHG